MDRRVLRWGSVISLTVFCFVFIGYGLLLVTSKDVSDSTQLRGVLLLTLGGVLFGSAVSLAKVKRLL